MKTMIAAAMFGCMLSTGALASTVVFNPDPGFNGGIYADYTLAGISSIGDGAVFDGAGASVAYNPGIQNLDAITFNFYPFNVGGSGSIPYPDSYDMTLTFKSSSGAVIDTETITLQKYGSYYQTFYVGVAGVHEVLFSSPGNSGRLISFDVSPVPEPATYGMMLAGLGVVAALRRRKQGA
jgi:hypothetical protein